MRTGVRALLLTSVLLGAVSQAGAQGFAVTGRCVYVDKAWDYDGWTGARPERAIRRADVAVVEALTNLVLGTGTTQADGSFSIHCAALPFVGLKVRCEADTQLSSGFQRLRVTNESSVDYALESQVFSVQDPTKPFDVGTLVAMPMLAGSSEGQPFNLFDMGVSALEYLTGPVVGASPIMQPLRIAWPSPGGTFTWGTVMHLGEQDGYDDAVALHELGHAVHKGWSGDDSQGGPHSFGESDQEPRLAFSEGFATLFCGAVQSWLGLEALYVDCDGSATIGGVQLRLRLETVAPWAGECFGEADEVAIACTLFDVFDDELTPDATPGRDDDLFLLGTHVNGLSAQAAWWTLFTGPLAAATNLAQQDAWDQWLILHAADPQLQAWTAAFEERHIRFTRDAQEPDSAPSLAVPTAAVHDGSWSAEHTLYDPVADSLAPGTGDTDHFAVSLVAGDVIEVATRYPAGVTDAETECDPYLELHAPSGSLVASDDNSGPGRNALLAAVSIDQSGTWLVKVGTHNALRRYGRYELRISYLSENLPPQLVAGPSAFPMTVRADDTSQLSALAVDPDGDPLLTYAWTPLDGGRIEGSGPNVLFDPPFVLQPAEVRVRLVVSDSFGATSAPAELTLTVLPATGGLCSGSAAWQSLGTGKPGLGGTPELVGIGLPIVPGLGFALRTTGLTPKLPGFMVFGFSQIEVAFDGGTFWVSPELLLPVTPSMSGELLIPLVLPPEPLLCGLSLYTQVIVPNDPGATGGKHTAQSNGLKLTFGD